MMRHVDWRWLIGRRRILDPQFILVGERVDDRDIQRARVALIAVFFHKGGMQQLTRFAASKLGPRGVRVNAIVPGGFFNNQDASFVARYNARTFLGRMANETDAKGAIVFLASDASAYITGATIPVDGGYAAK